MKRAVDIFFTAVLTVTACVWAWPNGGLWIGQYRPAAAPMVLHEARIVGDVIVFDGESARLWPQCAPRKLDWRQGIRGTNKTQPVMVNWGKPVSQPDGRFTFVGWIAEMNDLEAFKFGTFSDVLHECYVFASYDERTGKWVGGWKLPWLVRSPFWN